MKSDIFIIGAGLSGLTAAINLAKAGYKVRVYERNPDVGMRFHGDIQGLENWTSEEDVLKSLRRMNIKISFPYSARYSQELYDDDLNKAFLKSEARKPFYYLVRRGSLRDTLDYSLKKQAEESGVEIIYNKKMGIKDTRNTKDKWIIATGSLDSSATAPEKSGIIKGVAAGITFETNAKDRSIAILDDSIAPKAYAYLLIWDKKGTLATCMFENFDKGNECLQKSIERFKKIINFDMKNIKRFGGFVNFLLFSPRKTNTEKNRLYVGECAGFQDYLWGFGMGYAITSGYLAAKSIIENKDYDALWKSEFGGLLKTSMSNRYLFEKLGNSGYKRLIMMLKNNPSWFLMKNYNPSPIKKMVYPIARIKLKKSSALNIAGV